MENIIVKDIDDQKTLLMFKMPFSTTHFHEDQRVWVRRGSGSMAAEVRGKFRGAGRYITAWVSWESSAMDNPTLKEIRVSNEFYKKIRGDSVSQEWYERLNA